MGESGARGRVEIMARAENAGGSLPEPQKNTRQAAVPFC